MYVPESMAWRDYVVRQKTLASPQSLLRREILDLSGFAGPGVACFRRGHRAAGWQLQENGAKTGKLPMPLNLASVEGTPHKSSFR